MTTRDEIRVDDVPILRTTYEVVISLRVEAADSVVAVARTIGVLPADIGEVTYVSCEVADR